MLAFLFAGLLLAQDPDVEALMKMLEDESIEVRDKAASKLIELGDAAERKINARLASAEGEFKARLQGVLRDIGKARNLNSVFPKTRRVSLDVKDVPLSEVLDRLKKEAGLSIDAGSVGDRKVTVKIADVMPLEALDAVCQSADLEFLPRPHQGLQGRAENKMSETIVLRRGYTKVPRAFAGPFVVSAPSIHLSGIDEQNENGVRHSAAQLSLVLYWSPGFRPARLVDAEITSASDDKGNDLRRDAGLDGRRDMVLGDLLGDVGRPLGVQLRGPASNAQKMTLKGRGALIFTLDQADLSFKSPGDCQGQERSSDQMSIRLESCALGSGLAGFKVKVTQKGNVRTPNGIDAMDFSPSNVRLVTADGQKHPNKSWSATDLVRGGMTVELKWNKLKSDVTALEFVFDTEVHRADFEFELKDIPLPK